MSPPERNTIYLDYNATTPLDKDVQIAISNSLSLHWHNPSSSYSSGKNAHVEVEKARSYVASFIDAHPNEIVFTSGGTESNAMVFHSVVWGYQSQHSALPHIITSSIEHDSIKLPLMDMESRGVIELTILPINPKSGSILLENLNSAITHNTVLVSIMLANNETGAIADVQAIAKLCRQCTHEGRCGPLFVHTDAAQALGKIPVSVNELGVDYLTIVGHKFYGPRIGALYVRGLGEPSAPTTTPLKPIFFGGGQERGYRPGTQNTPMIVGLGEASRIAKENILSISEHMRLIRDYLMSKLVDAFAGSVSFAHIFPISESLPNTCNVAFLNQPMNGPEILSKCPILEASVGAACHSQSAAAGSGYCGSSILLASGVDKDAARKSLRLSIGRETTQHDIDLVVSALHDVIAKQEAA